MENLALGVEARVHFTLGGNTLATPQTLVGALSLRKHLQAEDVLESETEEYNCERETASPFGWTQWVQTKEMTDRQDRDAKDGESKSKPIFETWRGGRTGDAAIQFTDTVFDSTVAPWWKQNVPFITTVIKGDTLTALKQVGLHQVQKVKSERKESAKAIQTLFQSSSSKKE